MRIGIENEIGNDARLFGHAGLYWAGLTLVLHNR